jgi:hypothetical protein
MDLDHSSHVNDAHLLDIAPGAMAGSAGSSGLGRRRIGFRPSFSTLGRIILRAGFPKRFEADRLSALPDEPHPHLPCSPFVTEAEVARSLGGAGWLHSRIPGDTRGDAAQRMVRLGLTGTAGSIR